MTFPTKVAEADSTTPTASTTHTLNTPSGSGGVLVAEVGFGEIVSTLTAAGWVQIAAASDTSTTDVRGYILARHSEPTSTTLTTNVATTMAAHVERWADGGWPVAVMSSHNGEAPDPPNLTDGYGAVDKIVLAFCAIAKDDDPTTNPSAWPSGYGGTGELESGTQADDVAIGWGNKQVTAASENPGAFTMSGTGGRAVAATIAIPDAPDATWLGVGTRGAGTTTTTPTMPNGGAEAGGLRLAHRTVKPSTATAADETGWSLLQNVTGGTGTQGIDTGPQRNRVDSDEMAGGEGNPTFDQASTPNATDSSLHCYRKAASATWDVVSTSGDDATHGTGRSATGGAIALAPGDVVVAFASSDTDATTAYTAPAITASGITFGPTHQRLAPGGSATGQDVGSHVWEAQVQAGSGTVAPTLSLTGGPSSCGRVVFVRLRATAGASFDVDPDDATHGHTAGTPAITQTHEVAPANAVHASAATSPAITQAHEVAPASATHGHTATEPGVTVSFAVDPDDAVHAHAATSPAVTQTHEVAPASAAHGQVASSPAVVQAHEVAPADGAHAQQASSPAVVQAHEVAPDSAVHGHVATSPTVTPAGTIEPASTVHGHTATSPTVTQTHEVAPDSAVHAHTAQSPAITQGYAVAPHDALHGHAAGSPAITQAHAVAPHDAVHAHTATSPAVIVPSQSPPDTDAELEPVLDDRNLRPVPRRRSLAPVQRRRTLTAVEDS